MRYSLALICIAAAFVFGAEAADKAPFALTPVKVTERVWYVKGLPGAASFENRGFNSNAGFVVTSDGVVVIDALGTPALGREFLRAIRAVTDKPVRRVIVTHYHADHFYGLAAFREAGAEIWAHKSARGYIESAEALARLEQRRRDLSPWVDANTGIITPDRWMEGDVSFMSGGLHFDLIHVGPAHTLEDTVVAVREERVLFAGDILFSGRIPFVGNADSRRWLAAVDRLLEFKPEAMVPGHGAASRTPATDLVLTRDYLRYLRLEMGRAVEDMTSFEDAYTRTDWSRFERLPAFEAANRINAYGTYLLMERESLERK